MNAIQDAWAEMVKDAEAARWCYVSLYQCNQCYGGPEEGGWYYDAYALEESKRCVSMSEAEALKAKVEEAAERMTQDAKRHHDEICRQQCDAIEARDPMADIVDYGGPYQDTPDVSRYFVTIEDLKGERVTRERPHYE